MNTQDAIELLSRYADENHRKGLARYAIPTDNALGVRLPDIRKVAKIIGKNQRLAEQLWQENIHEAKHLAILIMDPKAVEEAIIDKWVSELYSWDLCDALTVQIQKTPFGVHKALLWCQQEEEFVKRCGFATLTSQVIHNKKINNETIVPYLELIAMHAWDNRNFVKKAVNWLLRQIGKRNLELNSEAVKVAAHLCEHPDASGRWIGMDAYRELTSIPVQERLQKHKKRVAN